jgi:signal transduction histidine kinase
LYDPGVPEDAPDDALERERLLLETVSRLADNLDLDQSLQRIVEAACLLVDARYAALGVIGEDRRLVAFHHQGIDDETVAAIGHVPEGLGVLGLLIDDPRPIRLGELSDHPAAVGFPANHPPMSSFLGVPIHVGGAVYGNLYLAEKRSGEEFSAADESLVVALAAAAGSIIFNARLHEDAQSRERSLRALQEIATGLLAGTDPDTVLQLVASHARELLDADAAAIALPVPTGDMLEVEVAVGDGIDVLGAVIPIEGSIAGEVMRTGRPVGIEDGSRDRRTNKPLVDAFGAGPILFVPLWLEGTPFGTLAVARRKDRARFGRGGLVLLQSFATQASLALEYARTHRELYRLAVYEDEERIARDLHDSVIQQLFAIGLSLQGAVRLSNDPALGDRLQRAVDDLDTTIRDIRSTIFALDRGARIGEGVHATARVLLTELADVYGLEGELHASGVVDVPLPHDVTAHVLSTLREAISNTGRHSKATRVDVRLDTDGKELLLSIEDNGIGMPEHIDRRSGLRNMDLRARALGGTMQVGPGEGGGTRVEWRVPLSIRPGGR